MGGQGRPQASTTSHRLDMRDVRRVEPMTGATALQCPPMPLISLRTTVTSGGVALKSVLMLLLISDELRENSD